jgi:hypothetical protein
MKFWDSSALVPLVTPEPQSAVCHGVARHDSKIVVWSLTPVEIVSALARKRREGSLASDAFVGAKRALAELEVEWDAIESLTRVRGRARRLLEMHALTAADALQLAAALLLYEERTEGAEFVTLDVALREAAEREGFSVLP